MNNHSTLRLEALSDIEDQSRRPYKPYNTSMARLCPGTDPRMEVPPVLCEGI